MGIVADAHGDVEATDHHRACNTVLPLVPGAFSY